LQAAAPVWGLAATKLAGRPAEVCHETPGSGTKTLTVVILKAIIIISSDDSLSL
jgi:hypothetical protein